MDVGGATSWSHSIVSEQASRLTGCQYPSPWHDTASCTQHCQSGPQGAAAACGPPIDMPVIAIFEIAPEDITGGNHALRVKQRAIFNGYCACARLSGRTADNQRPRRALNFAPRRGTLERFLRCDSDTHRAPGHVVFETKTGHQLIRYAIGATA